jgi:hypothetical protein
VLLIDAIPIDQHRLTLKKHCKTPGLIVSHVRFSAAVQTLNRTELTDQEPVRTNVLSDNFDFPQETRAGRRNVDEDGVCFLRQSHDDCLPLRICNGHNNPSRTEEAPRHALHLFAKPQEARLIADKFHGLAPRCRMW